MEPSSAPWRVLETEQPDEAPTASEPGLHARPVLALGAALLAAAVAAAAFLLAARTEPVIGVDGASGLVAGSLGQGGPPPTDPATPSGAIVVEVGGAVARPGVYRLPAGSRVGDAIAAAGGFGSRVDVTAADAALNLAAPVRDGEEIRVPARGEATAPTAAITNGNGGAGAGGSGAGGGGTGGSGAASGSSGGPMDLNRASAQELDTLPGVGPATAAKIITARQERPFASLDDFGGRKIVGAATLAKIRALVTVGP